MLVKKPLFCLFKLSAEADISPVVDSQIVLLSKYIHLLNRVSHIFLHIRYEVRCKYIGVQMSTRKVVALQYEQIVARAANSMATMSRPNEGWLRTVRKALQLSGAQLARRLGVTRPLVTQFEKAELTGGITLKKMQEMAEAMDCRLVYAVVPKTTVQETIAAQVMKKAKAYVNNTSKHMALEGQALNSKQLSFETQRLANEMTTSPPRDLWDED